MDTATDSSNTTVETTTLYHNVATDELSQMMMFFAIAFVAGGFSWLISKCVTVLHKRHLRKMEEEQITTKLKYKNQESFVIGNNEAAVFVNGTEVKVEEKKEASMYTRGFGITPLGMFDVAVDAMVRAKERKKIEKSDTPTQNGDIFETPVELFTPQDTPTEEPEDSTPVINMSDNSKNKLTIT